MIGLVRNLNRRLPGGLRRAILVRRRARYWRRAGIVFIHVPKAAGTSFNEALYGRFMGHPRASDIARWGSAAVRALPSFSVTRNPWDRLLSAYRFARQGGGQGETYRAGMWQPERYRVPEFESFERFVTQWLAERDVEKLDGVFQPQWLFLCDRDLKPLVDHVGRLEDLGPTYAFVERHIGRFAPIARANRSGEALDYRAFYTPETVELVGRIYRKDIETFGYVF
ncbi:MAG TPA: sulfotransferase family 2 domain-containing protein [Allosphingosinicella sp.]|nr:sulfotransferase family 2 domain-containing protein [Allosphingosinicella sp.]